MKFFIVVVFGLCSFFPSLSQAVTADYSFIPVQYASVVGYHVRYTDTALEAKLDPVLLILDTTVNSDERVHCEIKNLEENHMYLFMVTAIHKNGVESKPSHVLHFSTSDRSQNSIMTMTQVDKFRARIKRID